jgi:glycine/D-amino acid oxidase-like deaminating enzyme
MQTWGLPDDFVTGKDTCCATGDCNGADKRTYRVVVIGGGVVGASVLYHLAKFGWTDVCLIERSVLTAGSSWHAAGGFHALNADPNMAALQAYTIDLLSEIEEESRPVDIGLHMTGGLTLAGTPDRWEWLQSAYRTFQSIGIEDCASSRPRRRRALPDHVDRRHPRRHVGRPRGLYRHHRHRACLCQGRQEARRVRRSSTPGAGS